MLFNRALETYELAKYVFDGLLNARIKGFWWLTLRLSYQICSPQPENTLEYKELLKRKNRLYNVLNKNNVYKIFSDLF